MQDLIDPLTPQPLRRGRARPRPREVGMGIGLGTGIGPGMGLAKGLAMVVGVCLLGLVAGCGEEEQGGLQAASPGPDAIVGGEIQQIELLYDDILATVGGEVTGPDGGALVVDFIVDNQIRALAELAEPLSEPGEYTVRSEVVSVVGDEVEESYVFTYEPDAAPPQLVFPPEVDSGSPVLFWSLVAAGVAVIGVLLWRLVVSMRRLKKPPPPPQPPSSSSSSSSPPSS